ncbi:O-acyltransferase like protein-like [Chironomus tepperi]|uniref:O-acyltransferase like protein-like n=1 Tax=Chironomus tepperi TaxID=113505 RepID=UPI00391F8688
MDICEYYVRNFKNTSREAPKWMKIMQSSFSNFNKKLIYGNSYDFGDFDSCLATKIDQQSSVTGKYCMIKYRSDDVISVPPTLSLHNLKWKNIDESFGGAICIPSVCSNDVIETITNQLFNGTTLSLSTDYDQEEFCQVQKSINFNYSDYIIMSIILLYLLFILAITWKTRSVKEISSSYLSSFSILLNLKSLFEVKSSSLQYLSLIRTVLYIGLVSFHSYFLRSYYPLSNSEKMLKFMESPWTKFVQVFPFGLLGFFVISSALTTKKILSLLDKKSFNFFNLLIERYARTMFVVAAVIYMNIFINNLHVYQAPYYFPDQQSEGCRKYWWTAMLLIQNYYHPGVAEMCAPQCWFLSANFHFFILTPLVIYPIWRWKQSIWFIIPALLAASQAFIFLYAVQNESFLKQADFFAITDNHFSSFYLQSHYLASAWIIGILLGYIFYKCKDFEMNWTLKVFLIAFIASMFFKIFAWNFVFGQPEFNIFLFTIDRLLISLLAASVLFFCNFIHGEFEIAKLSANIPINLLWSVIDRVGLSLYIVHPAVIIGSTVILKQPMTFDIIPITITAFGDFLLSLILACILFVLIENPFLNITKRFLNLNFSNNKIEPKV